MPRLVWPLLITAAASSMATYAALRAVGGNSIAAPAVSDLDRETARLVARAAGAPSPAAPKQQHQATASSRCTLAHNGSTMSYLLDARGVPGDRGKVVRSLTFDDARSADDTFDEPPIFRALRHARSLRSVATAGGVHAVYLSADGKRVVKTYSQAHKEARAHRILAAAPGQTTKAKLPVPALEAYASVDDSCNTLTEVLVMENVLRGFRNASTLDLKWKPAGGEGRRGENKCALAVDGVRAYRPAEDKHAKPPNPRRLPLAHGVLFFIDAQPAGAARAVLSHMLKSLAALAETVPARSDILFRDTSILFGFEGASAPRSQPIAHLIDFEQNVVAAALGPPGSAARVAAVATAQQCAADALADGQRFVAWLLARASPKSVFVRDCARYRRPATPAEEEVMRWCFGDFAGA